MNEIFSIDINKININDRDYHFEYPQEEIKTLADSIKDNGLLQPIIVKRIDVNRYEIIQGFKRFKACLLNEMNVINAIVVDNDMYALKLMEAHNTHQLSVIEEAEILKRVMDDEGLTQSQLAKKLNISQSTIANKIRLLKLPDYIKKAILQKDISERHARALLKVKEKDLEKIFINIVSRKYTVKQTENYIHTYYNVDKKNRGYAKNINIGINTIKEAVKMCKKSGLDCEINEVNYQKEIKIIIRFKK